MITLMSNENTVSVCVDEIYIGTICLSENPNHKQNCYIELKLEYYDTSISAELFEKLSQIIRRPLQAMVSSCDTQIISFLAAGGFVCKRKCYEVEVTKETYVEVEPQISLGRVNAGQREYDLCSKTMYEYYIETHERINPWTSDYANFCKHLPAEVICMKRDGKIVAHAFVEDNEIAYVSGTDAQLFAEFARALVAEMLSKYETVYFESDDCDWATMQLRSLFKNLDETSFDTYVYDNKR